MQTNQKYRVRPGKIIAALIIILAVATVLHPSILFFLTVDQQNVIADFQRTYLTANNPLKSSSGSIDPLRILSLCLLIAECWAASLVIDLFSRKIHLKNRHTETIKGLICNLCKYAVVIYGMIFGLSILGVNMTAVIASLGILSLVVGFGAQTLIEDVITGLFFVFEGQFHVGDIVSIDGYRGTVTSIGIRSTRITDAGGNIKILSNSDIRTLTNLSEVDSAAVTDVGISYDADLTKAEKVIKEQLTQMPVLYPEIFHKIPSYSGVQELADSAVVLRIVAPVVETQIFTARRLLNRELKLALDRAQIEIPFPQVVVHKAK